MSRQKPDTSRHSRTRYLILGILSEAPLSGYDIAQLTRIRFRFFWNESYGQIYPELKRLAEEGLIEGEEGGGSRGKRLWSLTKAGRAALKAWLLDGESSDSARLETLLKTYFASAAPESLRGTLASFRGKMDGDIATLELAEGQLRSIPDPHKNHAYALATLEFGLATYRAWKAWAERWLKEEM